MKKIIYIFISLLFTVNCFAVPLSKKDVPNSLQPWISWVLYGEKNIECPFEYNNLSKTICAWPSTLDIVVNKNTALFSQKWKIFADNTWIELPGSSKLWPQAVMVNGKKHVVGSDIKSGNKKNPAVFIDSPGEYIISGQFEFDHVPEWIDIPVNTGLLTLSVLGKKILFPETNTQSGNYYKCKLRLKQNQTTKSSRENKIQKKIYRLIKDEIPLLMVTQINLFVSGQPREIILGNAVLNDFVPMKIKSTLPAKIEANGNLVVQVRPGKFTLQVTSRHNGYTKKISFPSNGFNVNEEIWAFEAKNYLRIVSIKGGVQIDPRQTTMPNNWKHFPTYLMQPGQTLSFIEKKRGEPNPAPDKLNLNRTLWLDFNGQGYSIKDKITGTMTSGWRMEMRPPIKLGRVVVNGKEQLITTLADKKSSMKNNTKDKLKNSATVNNAGVEIRYGNLKLEAESSLEKTGDIPATGWNRDFFSVKGVLNLPPGWTLFDASGIDQIKKTWLKKWTLLDLFIILIISFSVAKLRSLPWGILTLATMVLLNHEQQAPQWVFLNILAAIALLRVIPKGKIFSMITNYKLICIAFLIITSLPFMVNQIRTGIYPQLEKSWVRLGVFKENKQMQKKRPEPVKTYNMLEQAMSPPKQAARIMGKTVRKEVKDSLGYSSSRDDKSYYDQISNQKLKTEKINQNTMIQTGPGIPNWHWNSIPFSWNGPVEKDQTISFIFISPFANLVLSIIRVILLALLIYCLMEVSYTKKNGLKFSKLIKGTSFAVIFLFLCLTPQTALANDTFPPNELLQELKLKLTEKEKPSCAPNCAESPRMKINITNSQSDTLADKTTDKNENKTTKKKMENLLGNKAISQINSEMTIIIEIHSLHDNTAVPLPGSVRNWLPQIVLINQKKALSLYREPSTGYLWTVLTKGIHQIILKGILPQRDIVQLPLPLKPHFVEVNCKGWLIEGLFNNGIVDTQLTFTRINTNKNNLVQKAEFEPGILPPFIKIKRIFQLGLNWTINTTVTRISPKGSAITTTIPLLKGEAVTSNIRVKNSKVLINMPPNRKTIRWVSSLKIQPELILKAEKKFDRTEIWQANIGTMWHAIISGIPEIHHQSKSNTWYPQWSPWPGEEVLIKMEKPEGIKGQIHTIENTNFFISPGKKLENVKLNLKIRSSIGGSHVIKIPETAKIQSIETNGKSQPIRQIVQNGQNSVTVELVPGMQTIKLVWREIKNIKTVLKTSLTDLGIKSVNTAITVTMPRDRWILLCGGPYVGPAILFWGVVFVIILISIGLGRSTLTPLRFHHWLLLSLGLTQASILIAVPVICWFLALGYRQKIAKDLSKVLFNLFQILIIILTIAACNSLFTGIEQGLLGYPDMQISGNGSRNYTLNWYQDLSNETLPQAWVFSLPLTVYRVAILLWALWIAFAFMRWLRWAWECFSTDGLWRKIEIKQIKSRKKEEKTENHEEILE